MINNYFSINGEAENLIIIDKSKFICNIKHIESEDEAKDFISYIQKKHSLANHHCYAYIADELGLNSKFSDNGEPQGTAGLPMLEVLKNNNLKKIVAVTTRYFGGVLLGTGGLTRAYSGSVCETLKKSKKVNYVLSLFLDFNISYEKYSILQNVLFKNNIIVLSTDFNDKVVVKTVVKKNTFESFNMIVKETFNGEKVFDIIKEDFFCYGC